MEFNEALVTNEDSTEITLEQAELVEKRSKRPEIGAIWDKISTKGVNFFTIRVKLSKEELIQLTSQVEEGEEVAVLDLVAFPTKRSGENTRRPAFRVYKELR